MANLGLWSCSLLLLLDHLLSLLPGRLALYCSLLRVWHSYLTLVEVLVIGGSNVSNPSTPWAVSLSRVASLKLTPIYLVNTIDPVVLALIVSVIQTARYLSMTLRAQTSAAFFSLTKSTWIVDILYFLLLYLLRLDLLMLSQN